MALIGTRAESIIISIRGVGLLALLAAARLALAQPDAVPAGPLSPPTEPELSMERAEGEPSPTLPAPVAPAKSTPAPEDTTPAQEDIPLGDPAAAGQSGGLFPSATASAASTGLAWWVRTGLALVVVIGLIVLLRTALLKLSSMGGGLSRELGAGARAPSGVLCVLGRYPMARGQSLVLLKMDHRILLLGQTTNGFATLSEVTDPEEVASLLIKTRDEEGLSMAAHFNALLDDVGRDEGLLDEPISIVERPRPKLPFDDPPGADHDPATSLRQRLVGLRGLEA